MDSKPTVTIGIPAFNEEANIGLFLNDLLSQNQSGYKLDRLIVYSDGSNDRTTQIVEGKKSKKIVLIDGETRKGITHGITNIFRKAKSEIVVLLDADIRITDKNFLNKIIEPIVNHGSDLTSCRTKAVKPKVFIEKILDVGMKYKDYIFETYKGGNNLYTCHGPALAFSRPLYKNIYFKKSAGKDMYSYLFCVKHGYKYSYVRNTFVYYKLPDNFKDHQRQSTRFFEAKNKMRSFFDEHFIQDQFRLPLSLYLISFFKTIIKYPIYTPFYVIFVLNTVFKTHFLQPERFEDEWRISKSSKVLKLEKR